MASIEDKITRVMDGSYPNVAHVISPRAAGSDTLMTDGLSGWSTETAMNFITYRADSAGNVIEGTVRDWIGVANKANSSIINLKLLAGPEDDGSNVGDIVQPCASASYADRLAQALLESLDTDGKLKEGIVETKNIKDKAITPDKVDFASLPMFSASASGWKRLDKSGGATVEYNTVAYDTANMFDPSTFTAKVPKTGIYRVDVRCGVGSGGINSGATAYILLRKNGEVFKKSQSIAGSGSDATRPVPSISADILLQENDTLYVTAHSSDNTRNCGGDATLSEFSMRLVSYELN